VLRHALLAAGAGVAYTTGAAALARPLRAPPPPGRRPDIVMFVADDLSWADIGANGSPDAKTPNIDRLSREWMRFTRTFAASPTCTPSRSAMLTGDYPMHNGAHANHSFIRDDIRTLPEYLKALGYRVAIAGKTHIGPRADFPFEYVAGSSRHPPGNHKPLATSLNTDPIDRLFATRDPDVPLAVFIASYQPHVPWMPNRGFDPAGLTLPPRSIDTPETREAFACYLSDVNAFDRELGEVRASIARHGKADDTLFILTGDHGAQWPFAKWNLYDPGIHVPMFAVWPGQVPAGRTTDALISNVDILPTLLDAAGGGVPQNVDGRSFLPVLTGHASSFHDVIFAAHTGDGKFNRSPMRAVRTDRWKLIVNLDPDAPYTNIMTWKGREDRSFWGSWVAAAESDPKAATLLNRYAHRPAVELYDLENDPNETTNLAGDSDYRSVEDDLRKQLDQWRIRQGEKLTDVPMPEDARRGKMVYSEW
jgi:uncharacterized sulfatase